MSKLDDRKTPNIKGMGGQLGSVSILEYVIDLGIDIYMNL